MLPSVTGQGGVENGPPRFGGVDRHGPSDTDLRWGPAALSALVVGAGVAGDLRQTHPVPNCLRMVLGSWRPLLNDRWSPFGLVPGAGRHGPAPTGEEPR